MAVGLIGVQFGSVILHRVVNKIGRLFKRGSDSVFNKGINENQIGRHKVLIPINHILYL